MKMTLWESTAVHTLLLIAASLVPYYPGLSREFIFDDNPAVLNNKVLMSKSVVPLFSVDYWGGNLSSSTSHKSYRPVTSLTFWLQAKNPMTPSIALEMKMVNLLINCLNSMCIYYLSGMLMKACRITLSQMYCLSISLMFAIHPVHMEPVLSIVGRADLLYSLLFLVSIMFTLTRPHLVTKYLFISVLTVCSMFSKEQGILFLLYLAILHFSLSTKSHVFNRKSMFLLIYITIFMAVLVYVRLKIVDFSPPKFQRGDNPAAFQEIFVFKVLSFLYIYAFNSFLLLCPSMLSFDWAMGCIPLIEGVDPRLSIIFVFVCFLVLLVVVSIVEKVEGKPFLLVSFSLMIVPFLLCLNVVVRVGFVVAERSLYLSVLGYVLIYHYGMRKLVRYFSRAKLIYSIHLFCLVFLLLKTGMRSTDWTTETDLYTSGLKVCPNNAKIYYNIAKKYDQSKLQDQAKVCYNEAIRLEPEFEHALNNLGNLLRGEGRYADAERLLQRAVKVNPRFAAAHMNLAIVYQNRGKFRESENLYLKALSLRRNYPDCIFNLGNLYLKMKKFDMAEAQFRKGVDVGHELSYVNLVILLNEMEKLDEARSLSMMGITKFPLNPELRFQLANTLGKLGDYEAAEKEYAALLKLKEKSSYYMNLGVLYHRWKRYDAAERAYDAAIRMDPENKNARKYLLQVKTLLESKPGEHN